MFLFYVVLIIMLKRRQKSPRSPTTVVVCVLRDFIGRRCSIFQRLPVLRRDILSKQSKELVHAWQIQIIKILHMVAYFHSHSLVHRLNHQSKVLTDLCMHSVSFCEYNQNTVFLS